MHPRPRPFWRLAAVAAVAAWASAAPGAAAADPAFKDIIVGSPSYTSAVGHLCYSADGTVEVACPASSPFISSGGLLGIGTESPAYPLDVSGTVRATSFIGDGSGLTGVVASTGDRIVSGTTRMVADGATGLISITQAGTNTAYFHPQLGLVTVGVSSTGAISGTTGYFLANVAIPGGPVLSVSAGIPTLRAFSPGQSLAFTPGNNNSPEAMRIVSSGYVGIGTSAPSAKLHVMGVADDPSSGIVIGSSSGTNPFRMAVYPTGNYSTQWKINNSGALNITNQSDNSIWTVDGSTLRMGVRNIYPSTTLHVSGTIRMADGGEACDANRTGAIKYGGGDFSICRNGSAWESLSAVAAGAVSVTDGLSGSLVFRDQLGTLHGHPTISVSATTGSVGIGGGASSFAGNSGLSVVGQIYTQGNLILDDSNGINWANTGHVTSIVGRTTGGSYLSFLTSSTEAMRIVSSGFVGIGTSAPSAPLTISGSADGGAAGQLRIYNGTSYTLIATESNGDGFIRTNAAIYIGGSYSQSNSVSIDKLGGFRQNSANDSYFGGAGFLGIGTNRPSTTLHVSGTVRVTSWTMIGANASPTEALEVAGSIKASGSIKVSGTGGETCTGSADTGRIRVNPVTGRLQLCAPL